MKRRNYDRSGLLFAALICFGLAWAILTAFPGCGPGAVQRRLDTGERAIKQAQDTFVEWDEGHQLRLIELADPGTEEAVIERYQRKRDAILIAFVDAWNALEAAATDPKPSNWDALKEKSLILFRLVEELRR